MNTAYPHRAALGLGSNLGACREILHGALAALAEHPEIELVGVSSLYQSVAVGPEQPDYLNTAAVMQTTLLPEALLDFFLELEQRWGRVRRIRWGPRTLDLDLLLYDDLILDTPRLTVPHPHLLERNFALLPLTHLAPDWVHPLAQKPLRELAAQLDWGGLWEAGEFW
ncbi:2-amino-4-hydroxy-6-hydroxymethyldihydropteridine diphosphokinase [Anthocerotibacter panamensis]|uniref:2-amino-4-hydroxy-6- hydroxymethyldihydropteridine diphosphokinase n=1 Tax=Anthocerotibacter panamensis TaxID=2857077 RepID=UPI001C4034C7|nr:2-amino-4-hydroxy-6-hydroxymethyldihydropteridine diphosphokinase [Anthocerotibacter panamensis]